MNGANYAYTNRAATGCTVPVAQASQVGGRLGVRPISFCVSSGERGLSTLRVGKSAVVLTGEESVSERRTAYAES